MLVGSYFELSKDSPLIIKIYQLSNTIHEFQLSVFRLSERP